MNVRKHIKTLAFLIVGFILFYQSCNISPHHNMATHPEKFLKSLHIKLPDIIEISPITNHDLYGSDSQYSYHEYYISFSESLDEKTIVQLEHLSKTNKNWSKSVYRSSTTYIYSSNTSLEHDWYEASCRFSGDHVNITYNVDNDEGILKLSIILLFGLIWFVALIIAVMKRFWKGLSNLMHIGSNS